MAAGAKTCRTLVSERLSLTRALHDAIGGRVETHGASGPIPETERDPSRADWTRYPALDGTKNAAGWWLCSVSAGRALK